MAVTGHSVCGLDVVWQGYCHKYMNHFKKRDKGGHLLIFAHGISNLVGQAWMSHLTYNQVTDGPACNSSLDICFSLSEFSLV